MDKAIDFIKYFIHPNLTAGGSYGSRNTEYLIPHGFYILADKNKTAEYISDIIFTSFSRNSSIFPNSTDERYLCYNLYTYLQAFSENYNPKELNNEKKQDFEKHFRESGLTVINSKYYYLIFNAKKGGAFVAYFKKSNKLLEDSGLQVITKNKTLDSFYINDKFNKLNSSGKLQCTKNSKMSTFAYILSRLVQATLGRNEKIGKIIKEKLTDNKTSFLQLSVHKKFENS